MARVLRGARKIERLEHLRPDTRNANKGTARGRSALETSLEKFGAGRSILADRDGNVIAGNKTLEVAVEKGLTPRFVHTDGHELVVVIRTDLQLDGDDGKARQLAYADNRVAELDLEWDASRLLEDAQVGVDLDVAGFREHEVAALLSRANIETPELPADHTPKQRETVKTDRTIVIECSHADLAEFKQTLKDWAARDGVVIKVT